MFSVFSDLSNTLTLAFGGHCLREVFQTLRDYNLQFIRILISLTLFQGHSYVKVIICKVFLDSCRR